MNALLRLAAALLLVAGSIVLSAHELYELVRTGTCGAPAGAVAYRACPAGTGTHVLLLIASIFVLPFAGILLSPMPKAALGILWWCFLWIAMGSAALVAGEGPAAPPGASSGGLGVGITFLVIGVVSLLVTIAIGIGAARGARAARR